jgi:TfoX/Sxy family transcriptional regulator of competence genes
VAFDEVLARRVEAIIGALPGVSQRRMFGGLCFLLSGKMVCGVAGDDLMLRVGADAYEDALRQPNARPMDFTGRPLRGFVYVGRAGYRSDADLAAWIAQAVHYVSELPDQPSRKRPRQPPRPRARAKARK